MEQKPNHSNPQEQQPIDEKGRYTFKNSAKQETSEQGVSDDAVTTEKPSGLSFGWLKKKEEELAPTLLGGGDLEFDEDTLEDFIEEEKEYSDDELLKVDPLSLSEGEASEYVEPFLGKLKELNVTFSSDVLRSFVSKRTLVSQLQGIYEVASKYPIVFEDGSRREIILCFEEKRKKGGKERAMATNQYGDIYYYVDYFVNEKLEDIQFRWHWGQITRLHSRTDRAHVASQAVRHEYGHNVSKFLASNFIPRFVEKHPEFADALSFKGDFNDPLYTNPRDIGGGLTTRDGWYVTSYSELDLMTAVLREARRMFGLTDNELLNEKCSEYGRTNSQEFMAEAFDSMTGGEPSEIGQALASLLKKIGYIK